MRALLISMGSMGDTLPFLAIGRRLRERGHEVTLAASGYFRENVQAAGLAFVETFSREEYLDFIEQQRRWSPTQALDGMLDLMLAQMPRVFETIQSQGAAGTIVVAQGYAIGARIAQETLGIPTATIHVQPLCMRSTRDIPGIPRWVPGALVRFFDRIVDDAVDKRIGPEINRFRSQFGLPPATRFIKNWWNSPHLVLGLFPEWFDRPRDDWPPNAYAVGFPFCWEHESQAVPTDDLRDFVESGDPPIVFSQSSVRTDEPYLRESIDVARRLGRRAVLISPYSALEPPPPPGVLCVPFVPLSWLLPRAVLHVHHGGIGSIAHSLAAGIPQLTVPMTNDQPDNANRLLRLGVSDLLPRKKYCSRFVLPKVERLLAANNVAEKCRIYAEKIRNEDGLQAAAIQLEQFAQRALSITR